MVTLLLGSSYFGGCTVLEQHSRVAGHKTVEAYLARLTCDDASEESGALNGKLSFDIFHSVDLWR